MNMGVSDLKLDIKCDHIKLKLFIFKENDNDKQKREGIPQAKNSI